jgi:hypothetical protein
MDNSKRNLKSKKTKAQQDYKRAYEFMRGATASCETPTVEEIAAYNGVSLDIAWAAFNTYFDRYTKEPISLIHIVKLELPF